MTRFLSFALLGLLAVSTATARDWHVNHEKGDDARDGSAEAPLKSVALAIKNAQPGDTIHLAKTETPYPAGITFHNKSGEPGKPITLDGHGATVSGALPLAPSDWKLIEPGLIASSTLLDRADRAVIDRFFFLFDGKMNRMGRSLKGPKEPWKKPEELSVGEWCWVEEEQTFYLKLDPERALLEQDIQAPMTSNGVAISGECHHLVIRNLTSTHVYNDGFNIHGKTRDVRFENIKAKWCGDDGVSAHGDCRIVIDGLVSIGNSTGVCHVNDSHSEGSRHFIAACHGYAYFVLDQGVHTLRDSAILCDAAQSIVINGPRDEASEKVCRATFENVFIRGTSQSDMIKANRRTEVAFRWVTVSGLSISAAGNRFRLERSAIGGKPKPEIVVYPHARWEASGNLLDLDHLRIGPDFFNAASFATYQEKTGQGKDSRWEAFNPETWDLDAGADFDKVPGKNREVIEP